MLQSTEENKLTLITCISGKKQQRLCVQATEKTCNIINTELPQKKKGDLYEVFEKNFEHI